MMQTTGVAAVLLADGWHNVADGTFELGGYQITVADSRQQATVVPSWRFTDDATGETIFGPTTALHGVKIGAPKKPR